MKRYTGPDWPAERISGTLAIQRHLVHAGLPVPGVIAGPLPLSDGLLVAMAFLPGERVAQPVAEHAAQAGAALGLTHASLASLPVTDPPRLPQSDRIRTEAAALINAASARQQPDTMDELAMAAARFRLDWLERHPIDPDRYDQQTWQMVHGDYYPGNLLYTSPTDLSGIVDFDFAGPRFRSLELARALVEFSLTPTWQFRPDLARTFLTAYLRKNPVSQAERTGGFRTWLEYLLGSLYPLPLRYAAAPLPHGWERLAQRRHDLLCWLAAHLAELEQVSQTA